MERCRAGNTRPQNCLSEVSGSCWHWVLLTALHGGSQAPSIGAVGANWVMDLVRGACWKQVEKPLLLAVSLQCPLLTKLRLTSAGKGKLFNGLSSPFAE